MGVSLYELQKQQASVLKPMKRIRLILWFVFGGFVIIYVGYKVFLAPYLMKDQIASAITDKSPKPVASLNNGVTEGVEFPMGEIDLKDGKIEFRPTSQAAADLYQKMINPDTANAQAVPEQPVPPQPDAVPAGTEQPQPAPQPEPQSEPPVVQPLSVEPPSVSPAIDVFVPKADKAVVFDGVMDNEPMVVSEVNRSDNKVFWYFIKYLVQNKPDVIKSRVKPHFRNYMTSFSACLDSRQAVRGEHFYGRGILLTYSPRRLDRNPYGLEDTWEGYVSDTSGSGFYFCSTQRLPVKDFELLRDEIEFEGVFVYLMTYENEMGNYRIVPYIMTNNIRLVKPVVVAPGGSLSIIMLVIVVFVVGGLVYLTLSHKQQDKKYKELLAASSRKKPLAVIAGTDKDSSASPTERLGDVPGSPRGGGKPPNPSNEKPAST